MNSHMSIFIGFPRWKQPEMSKGLTHTLAVNETDRGDRPD
jgi:hypothetical protein